MRRNSIVKITRYVIVGVATLAVYLTIGALLQITGVNVAILAPIAFAITVTVNYLLQRIWVFADSRPISASLPKYALMVTTGFALNSYTLITLSSHMTLLLAQLIAAALVVFSNILFSFLWTFRTTKTGNLRS